MPHILGNYVGVGSDERSSGKSPLLTGLSAYWKMDETSGARADATGNGFTLTDNNTCGFGTGIKNNAVAFVKENLETLTLTPGTLFPDSTSMGEFSIAGRYNLSSTLSDGIIQGLTDCNGSGIRWSIQKVNSTTVIIFLNVTGAGGVVGITTASLASTMDAWHHYAISYSLTTSKATIYMDGTNVGEAATKGLVSRGTPSPGGSEMLLGRDLWISGNYNTGMQDEWGVWKAKALSQADVTLLQTKFYPF